MKKLSVFIILFFSAVLFFTGCQKQNNPVATKLAKDNLAKKSVALYVPDDYSSIQAAVDAISDKGVIYVKAGEYHEAVTIDGKDIKLLAVGDVTLAPSTPTVHGDAITIFNGKVTIDGVKVDASNCFNGIYARALETESPVNVDILNNYVFGYEKNGITVNGSNAYGNVEGNSTIGSGPVGPGSWAQNGIQFGYGANGKAMNNDVEGHWYTGANWGATGILIFETNGVMVQNNKVIECQFGISAQAWGWFLPSVDGNRIIKNTLTNCEYGISVSAYSFPGYSTMDATATNNKVTNNVIKVDAGTGEDGIDVYTYNGDPSYSATANNNKVIHNTIEGYSTSVYEGGTMNSKIHANVYQ